MEYLNHILGIKVSYLDDVIVSMPNYILNRYSLKRVKLDGVNAIFVYPLAELDTINAVRKHIERIGQAENVPVVLILNKITYRQKEYLLRDHISFVVDGKQIYLPFMAIYLQERCNGEKKIPAEILPSAQLVLLYFIYHGCGKQVASEIARALDFSSTSISRACNQLEGYGLIQTEKQGYQKIIKSEKTPKELFEIAENYLCNPIKRTIYIPNDKGDDLLPMSGYSALAEYSMLNPPAIECRATDSISVWEKESTNIIYNADDQCEIELWRYNPLKLSSNGCVDKLSLVLSLKDDCDERVEEATQYVLDEVWREIDGKRY